MSRLLIVSCLVAATLLSGCNFTGGSGEKPVATIIRQATPNPLLGATSYRLAPVTFEKLTFYDKTEAQWMASRDGEQNTSWENDKRELTGRLLERFEVEAGDGVQVAAAKGKTPAGTFVLAINVDKFDNSTFLATLRVLDASGEVVDEIRLPPRYGGQLLFGSDSVALSLNTFVTWAPADTMEYLRARAAR